MTSRIAIVVTFVAMTLAGCDNLIVEHMCSDGEYPVKPIDAGMGGQCVKDGEKPPAGLEAYPKGKVPEVVGDKWDKYWSEKQAEKTNAEQVGVALSGLKPADEPQGWKRLNIGEVGSIAVPSTWTVKTGGTTTRLSDGTTYVEVTLVPGGAAELDTSADAIRKKVPGDADPVYDIDTGAAWPGGTDSRYLRMSRGFPGDDDYVSTEALLVVAQDGSLVTVRGSINDSDGDKDIDEGTVPSRVLRSLLLRGA